MKTMLTSLLGHSMIDIGTQAIAGIGRSTSIAGSSEPARPAVAPDQHAQAPRPAAVATAKPSRMRRTLMPMLVTNLADSLTSITFSSTCAGRRDVVEAHVEVELVLRGQLPEQQHAADRHHAPSPTGRGGLASKRCHAPGDRAAASGRRQGRDARADVRRRGRCGAQARRRHAAPRSLQPAGWLPWLTSRPRPRPSAARAWPALRRRWRACRLVLAAWASASFFSRKGTTTGLLGVAGVERVEGLVGKHLDAQLLVVEVGHAPPSCPRPRTGARRPACRPANCIGTISPLASQISPASFGRVTGVLQTGSRAARRRSWQASASARRSLARAP